MRVRRFSPDLQRISLERSRQMLTSHSTGGFATTSAPQGFDLKDFEEAGLRAVERRFGPRYKIYGDYKEATTALLKQGGVFGKLNLVEGRWQDVFAEAVTDSRVASIQKAPIERVIKSNPGFALKLFSSFSERLRQSDEVIESLLHREVSTRLATLLINLGERFGESNGVGTLIDVRLTHQDLANMIASTREAVSKVMSELQRDGVIESRNRRIVIVNGEALAEYASRLSGLSIDGQAAI